MQTIYIILSLLNIYILAYGIFHKLWGNSETTKYVVYAVGILFFLTPYIDRLYLDLLIELGVVALFIRAVHKRVSEVLMQEVPRVAT